LLGSSLSQYAIFLTFFGCRERFEKSSIPVKSDGIVSFAHVSPSRAAASLNYKLMAKDPTTQIVDLGQRASKGGIKFYE
jgi:hypothetical protein